MQYVSSYQGLPKAGSAKRAPKNTAREHSLGITAHVTQIL